MRSLSIVIAIAAAFSSACFAEPSDEQQVRDFATQFIEESLTLSPSNATSQGYYEHRGTLLDEIWDDYSPAGVRRAIDFYNRSLQESERLDRRGVNRQLHADLEVIRYTAGALIFDAVRAQVYRHNPTLYVEEIGNGLYNPFIEEYEPLPKRLQAITARIEKLPAFLTAARQNLVDCPEIWNRVAQQENDGNIDLIDHVIRAKVPADLKPRYDRAAEQAIAALHAFNDFLKNDLSRHTTDWRLGSQLYNEKFKWALATGDTPSQVLADAEAKLESLRHDMYKQALAVYPKFFPGEQPPGDLNGTVAKVLEKIAQRHATPADYFDHAKRDLATTTQFVEDHHLLALPHSSNLQVIPTPVFMRGIYAVGGFAPAPAFDPKLGSFYWITPFTPDMSPDRVESKLREYNTWGLAILTIHEAMPGHFVQFEYANEVEPKWRRLLRELFSNTPYVEGWAVFATELMIDAGYEDTPEMRLTFGKQMLRVVANTILDVKLQTGAMTDQQALDLMIRDTFQEKEEAEKKLQRAKLSSGQLPAYFVGWRGWQRIRDAYREKQGAEFRISDFNERALKQGGVPLPVLRELMLDGSTSK